MSMGKVSILVSSSFWTFPCYIPVKEGFIDLGAKFYKEKFRLGWKSRLQKISELKSDQQCCVVTGRSVLKALNMTLVTLRGVQYSIVFFF